MKKKWMYGGILVLALAGACAGSYKFMYEQYLIHKVHTALKEMAHDPDSLQFRNERVKYFTAEGKTFPKMVCGEINAKNGLGGYSGFQAYKVQLSVGEDAGSISEIKTAESEIQRMGWNYDRLAGLSSFMLELCDQGL